MKLFQIYFQYGDHEEESEIYAADNNDHATAHAYLLKMYSDDYIEDPKKLKIEGVHEFNTVNAANGDPYKVAFVDGSREVVIEVRSGVAEVTEAPDDISVEIIDYDNEES